MSYTKPYAYVDGTVLDASNQSLNDDAAKKFINQGIVQADYTSQMINFDSIQIGELEPITSAYKFMSGEIHGHANDRDVANRSYFTSHIKNGRQTSINPEVFQDVSETGKTLYLSSTEDLLISFGGSFISDENDIQANGRWDSRAILRYKEDSNSSNWQNIEGTRGYSFEETYDPQGAGAIPFPCETTTFNAIAYPNSSFSPPQLSFKRWIGWTWIIKALPPGYYQFTVSITSKVEQGFVSARSFTCEVFYC